MNKNGFTLVELLAVITILALIGLITSISVANMVKESKAELSDMQKKSIKLAAQSWGSDNIDELPTGESCIFLTLKDLKDSGFLDSNILDPKNKKAISDDIKIKISSELKNGKSVLKYEVNPNSVNNCTYSGSALYVDLFGGLTPVVYDGDNWVVADPNDSNFYDYTKQKWANAVVLSTSAIEHKKNKIGTVLTVDGNNPDVLMMLVWIPRYEYKIEGTYGKDGTQAEPGEIEIKFINTSKEKADDGYTIHPAFEFGGKQLSGIWVGKFELSHTTKSQGTSDLDPSSNLNCTTKTCSEAKNLRILPNVPSLRYNNVSNFWYGIKSIENTNTFGLSNIDSHMMKNSEWGAVAYLSQSKYGKYGNSDYAGANKEIYQNKSNEFKTGKSNGTPSTSTSNTQCDYDVTLNNCGPGASTTGNIYGVYDMSGGAYEYVMGVFGTNDNIYSGFSDSINSGFNGLIYNDNNPNMKNDGLSLPDSKYYNKYLNNNDNACINNECIGHALSETKEWYNDVNNKPRMVNSEWPWFVRGGAITKDGSVDDGDDTAGIFYYNDVYGSSGKYYSTRVTFVIK